MGLSHRPDHLEAEPLKLTAQHLPLPTSLHAVIQERFADTAADGPALTSGEIRGYLRNWEDLALTPMEAIMAQTEAIGDPGLPGAAQVAILRWLGVAFSEWEQAFPLAAPLASELRRLKPLAAILAISDPEFLTPGQHPLHQLIDNLHDAAIGWQARLGRAGAACYRQVTGAVDDAMALLDADQPAVGLAQLNERVQAESERDSARAGRMTQRMIEAEQGRIKTARAKRQAGAMINTLLGQYPAPVAIGHFLKGPWYDSAQLLLLKFGSDSAQWRQMTATTEALLESVQVSAAEDPEKRQQLFNVVTQLPRQLKRWLLSLQHDDQAVGDALAVIESAHLMLLRRQAPEMERIEPLPVSAAAPGGSTREIPETVQAGRWFRLEPGDGSPLRVRLALRLDDEGQLLFANQAGIIALQTSFDEFADLLESGGVSPLQCGASFSLSLARAAGIDGTAQLDALLGPEAARARQQEEQREREQARAVAQARLAEEEADRQREDRRSAGLLRRDILEKGLPMGAWLCFHDAEPALQARLGAHDPQTNLYDFVDRHGCKLRQIAGEALHELVDSGMVDLLQEDSGFRDRVERLQRRLDD